jgi:hypothetical protein
MYQAVAELVDILLEHLALLQVLLIQPQLGLVLLLQLVAQETMLEDQEAILYFLHLQLLVAVVVQLVAVVKALQLQADQGAVALQQ